MLLGISLKIASALVFTLMAAGVKALSAEFPTVQIVFFRSLLGVAVLCLWLWMRGDFPHALVTQRVWGHFARGAVGVVSMTLGFVGVFLLPLADATALGYVAPLIAVMLAALFLNESVRIYRWSAVAMGFVGVLVMVWEHVGGHGASLWGVGSALASAVLAAVAATQVRQLTRTENTGAIVFYFSLFATLASAVALLATTFWPQGWAGASLVGRQAWVAPVTVWHIGLLCMVGISGGIGQILMTESYRHADASIIACFDYTSMIWALLLAVLIFGETPTLYLLVGAGIIAASGLFVIWREHRLGLIRKDERKVTPTRPL